MSKDEKEELVDAFEEEEIERTETEPAPKKKKAKPAEKLTSETVREDKDGNPVIDKYEEYLELLGGWDKMSEADRRKINASFKKPGRAFGEGVDVETLPPAHRKALDLIKQISDAAYAGVENNAMDIFNELQALNPNDKLSVEVYIKGKKPFVAGLPTE